MELQSGNASFRSKSACVNLKFDALPCKTIGHPTSSVLYHSIAIGQFKLELHSGNAYIGSKSTTCFCPVWLEVWKMTLKTIGHLCYIKIVHHSIAIGEFKVELLSNSGQNLRFWSRMNLKFDGWPRITIGHLFFVHHFVVCVNSNWSYSSQTPKLMPKFVWPLWPWSLNSDQDLLHGHHLCQW